jgi:hypothetical protein
MISSLFYIDMKQSKIETFCQNHPYLPMQELGEIEFREFTDIKKPSPYLPKIDYRGFIYE